MWRAILASFLVSFAFAGDDHCPGYPESQRISDRAQFQKEKAFYAFSANSGKQPKHLALQLSASANFIDDFIFGKMVTDGVEPAPLATDEEIIRRLSLDLTGRIPAPDLILNFLMIVIRTNAPGLSIR